MAVAEVTSIASMFGLIGREACQEFVHERRIRLETEMGLGWCEANWPRVIPNHLADGPYLERYYISGGPSESDVKLDQQVYLHRFVASDNNDSWLHNHPWEHAAAFILAGGYREERRILNPFDTKLAPHSYRVESQVFKPFSVNMVTHETFHRVDLIEEDCWTLFVVGKKTAGWDFWNRETGEEKDWETFLCEARGIPVPFLRCRSCGETYRLRQVSACVNEVGNPYYGPSGCGGVLEKIGGFTKGDDIKPGWLP